MISLGTDLVAGRNRVPRPATGKMALVTGLGIELSFSQNPAGPDTWKLDNTTRRRGHRLSGGKLVSAANEVDPRRMRDEERVREPLLAIGQRRVIVETHDMAARARQHGMARRRVPFHG